MAESLPLTVCYFGAYKPTYPRNLFYRQALARLGVTVVECCVSTRLPTIVRAFQLLQKFWRGAHRANILFVAEFNHTLVPLAWLLARLRGMTLVFDPGLSFYDWYVLLLRAVAPRSLRGTYLWVMETLAFRLPDLVIWFTPLDSEYFVSLFNISPERSTWLPPGIDTSLFFATPLPEQNTPFILHWDGNMAPMHGVDVILRAARLLVEESEIQFEFIGGVLPEVRALADELRLPNVQFFGTVSPEELRASVQRAHICLGVFRGDDKLRRSLYTKELQAMMAGRPLITGYGEAKERLFRSGTDLIMIPPENPEALAQAVRDLRADPARRGMLAREGASAVAALCDPQNAGTKLLNLLRVAYARRRSVGQMPS